MCMHLTIEYQTMKQKPVELQREINESKIIVGDFDILLTQMDDLAGRKMVRT